MTALIMPHHGKSPVIHESAFIADTAVVIGDVEIGEDSGIWFGCVIRGDVNVVRIGARTNIQDGVVIHVASRGQGTYIGDDITIGHMALLHACTLESGCFVGMKACLMDGSYVEGGGMVAAGALLTPGKRVRKGELWAGTPARFMRDVTPEEIAFFPQSARQYVDLAASYRRP
ncbi:gamma carbonic anhydrase family protein [Skermanella mucosa]|uniref:gamma carbonic anhydrase family protein n=1 Tax=Skermanella mucosa TaxID=1789672 RepID=UPI00192C6F25|nr:gamma carbonic anhydrase family protein [Skermanella mucosa]UEM23054.1 gamma carbonic anhydrase family protein [Skermanella mucosa]